MHIPLPFSPDMDISVISEPLKGSPSPNAYYTLNLIPNHQYCNKISKTHHNEIPSPIFVHSNCQLIHCSVTVTFSCSIETLNKEKYPTLFYLPPLHPLITLGQRLQSTIALGFQNLSAIPVKESFQLLVNLCNLPPLPSEAGMRPTEPEDNLTNTQNCTGFKISPFV